MHELTLWKAAGVAAAQNWQPLGSHLGKIEFLRLSADCSITLTRLPNQPVGETQTVFRVVD